ncbi:MAG: hypothetical protein WBY93_06205 [Candidatus Binatus sp.]
MLELLFEDARQADSDSVVDFNLYRNTDPNPQPDGNGDPNRDPNSNPNAGPNADADSYFDPNGVENSHGNSDTHRYAIAFGHGSRRTQPNLGRVGDPLFSR